MPKTEMTGVDGYKNRMTKRGQKLERDVNKALLVAAAKMVSDVQELISIPVSSKGRSLPSEPPHLETGALRRSVRIEKIEDFSVTVAAGGSGTAVDYARALEYGSSSMEPRPFFFITAGPILSDLRFRLYEILSKVVAS